MEVAMRPPQSVSMELNDTDLEGYIQDTRQNEVPSPMSELPLETITEPAITNNVAVDDITQHYTSDVILPDPLTLIDTLQPIEELSPAVIEKSNLSKVQNDTDTHSLEQHVTTKEYTQAKAPAAVAPVTSRKALSGSYMDFKRDRSRLQKSKSEDTDTKFYRKDRVREDCFKSKSKQESSVTVNRQDNIQNDKYESAAAMQIPEKVGGVCVPTIAHNPIENDRQILILEDYENNSRPKQSKFDTSAAQFDLLGYLFKSLSLQGLGTLRSSTSEQEKAKAEANVRRTLRVRLSLSDPSLPKENILAHQLFVSGETLQAMRSAGVTARHLIEVGLTYAEWRNLHYGIEELIFMNGTWEDLTQMGFSAAAIVSERDISGPTVLSKPPLCVTFDMLERDLGMTIDDAIFEYQMSTADLSMFGETMTSVIKRGFSEVHAISLQEPAYNYEISLQATAEQLMSVGLQASSESKHHTRTKGTTLSITPEAMQKQTNKHMNRGYMELQKQINHSENNLNTGRTRRANVQLSISQQKSNTSISF